MQGLNWAVEPGGGGGRERRDAEANRYEANLQICRIITPSSRSDRLYTEQRNSGILRAGSWDGHHDYTTFKRRNDVIQITVIRVTASPLTPLTPWSRILRVKLIVA
jgi:hypothetical protein